MSDNYKSAYELVNALKYGNLKDGEVIFKIDGETWVGLITEMNVNFAVQEAPAFQLVGIVKQ